MRVKTSDVSDWLFKNLDNFLNNVSKRNLLISSRKVKINKIFTKDERS